MKILYITYGPQSGVVGSLTDQLRARGNTVELFNPVDRFFYKRRIGALQVPNPRPDVLRAIIEAILEHGRHWKAYFFHSCYAFDRLTALVGDAIKRTKPDAVLQAGVLFSPGVYRERPYYLYCDHTRAIAERYAALEGLLPGPPFRSGWRAREQTVYRNAVCTFVMSEFVKSSLIADYGVEPSRIRVVGAGPNIEATPADLERPRDRAFLFVGIDFVSKGGPELLQAFAKVRSRHADVKLWVVGGMRPEIPVPGVTFFGHLGKKELAGLYSTASWFVLPTLREAFGISYLEAMGFGLPCIGSSIEAISEIIDAGRTGLLVPPRDVDALQSAMTLLVENPSLARSMGQEGREKVNAQFGWSKCADRIVEVLQRGSSLSALGCSHQPK